MKPPISSFLVQSWFNWYCRFTLRKHFHRVHLFGDVPSDPALSTLYVANHSSFWDAIALNFLIHQFRRQKAYCMSDQVQVDKHPFFRRVGAFSVDRTNPRDGMRAVKFAAKLLNEPPCAVVIFPQGQAQPNDCRPIQFQQGVDRILQRAPACQVVIAAIRYEFWLNQRPELLIDLSTPTERSAAAMAVQVTSRLDALIAAGKEYQSGSRILLTGRRSIAGG